MLGLLYDQGLIIMSETNMAYMQIVNLIWYLNVMT